MSFDYHELASMFPLMEGQEYADLKADIAANGLREPIWLYQGRIIDGRNRYRACQELGIEPASREWNGRGDLLAFVVSLNLHRRHLSESQRAMIAARLADRPEGRPKETGPIGPVSNSQAASMFNVGERTVKRAKQVHRYGVPELTVAVEAGRVSVDAAAEVAELPEPEQEAVVAKGPETIKAKAKEVREEKAARNGHPKPSPTKRESDGSDSFPVANEDSSDMLPPHMQADWGPNGIRPRLLKWSQRLEKWDKEVTGIFVRMDDLANDIEATTGPDALRDNWDKVKAEVSGLIKFYLGTLRSLDAKTANLRKSVKQGIRNLEDLDR